MKKSLTINATRAGKKVSKNIGYVNPDVANSLVGGFAQMVNALTTDTFVNAEVVKKMDTNEQEQQSGGGSGKQEGIITLSNWSVKRSGSTVDIEYNGDGTLYGVAYKDFNDTNLEKITISEGSATVTEYDTDGGDTKNSRGFFFATATDNFTAAVHVFHEIN